MNWKIRVYRAKPNPAGKDRAGGIPLQEQLLGEWVDLQNVGDTSVGLSTIYLCNVQYSQSGVPEKTLNIYWIGKPGEVLVPGQIVRVHTGRSAYVHLMRDIDKQGVHMHSFAEKGNFVLNNRYGDVISVWWKTTKDEWSREDYASYDANPPDGAILRRIGEKLIP